MPHSPGRPQVPAPPEPGLPAGTRVRYWAGALPEAGPLRPLAAATLASRVGRGLLYTILPLYLTRVVGLSAGQVGLGLTSAALLGMAVGIPAGHLADVLGPRGLRVAVRLAEATVLCGYVLVGGFGGFLVAAGAVAVCESAGEAAEGALIGGSLPPAQRVRGRAYLRAVTNVGWGLGAATAAVALAADSRPVYRGAVFAAAGCYLVSALATRRVPPPAPVRRPPGRPQWAALRDGPYAVLTLLNAVLSMNVGMFTVALPLYIADRTGAPLVLYAGLVLLNTTAAALWQQRASRSTGSVPGAATAQWRAGVLLAVACGLFALADGRGAEAACLLLSAGAAVHVYGELLQAAGSWGLSYELAPVHAVGQYQGVYGVGRSLGQLLTPVVASSAMTGWGWGGCVLLGGLFLAAGAPVPAAARWALARREAQARS
ncbi:MFS transporter [Streptomyces sp. NPDC005423]|uniref:MFS transporter n=1 Tax=Streptomyces sp. NPDC005423 TaxID=3155343 RepID=UPI0033A561CF